MILQLFFVKIFFSLLSRIEKSFFVLKGSLNMNWQCGNKTLELTRPYIMGILNVTPDSFSDGGEHQGLVAAVEHAKKMVAEGADIIDVGGESTRPGAADVSVEEEVKRVVPVVKALVELGMTVSVDTSKAEVMKESIKSGAHIINDIRALREPGALEVVAQSNVGVCLMHMQGQPRTMQVAPHYEDLIAEVEAFLMERARVCEEMGIARERICLDYGFGFGKTVEQNFKLLAHTNHFVQLPYPHLVGLSRKSSLGAVTGRETKDRLVASVTGALLAAQGGAQIIRVHDVAATKDAFTIWSNTVNAK